MKRFLLFAYDLYYPLGGILDLHGDYATHEEALAVSATLREDVKDIIDSEEYDTDNN
jgi:hypothetical protein